ncbi:MAG: NAD(P)H-dependent oxidoreductase [Alphaproteobacteria bacterium]|nr:NAD(P)H-dependent oxidoreductase [Alphaproteobacteria bacterium]
MKVLGISGSLREGSFNTAALRAAQELAPDGMTIEIADISEVPPYNEDARGAGFPAAVDALRQGIVGADALLISTPEYNYSISGVLKNAIDWASRPPDQPFDGKAIAILGASAGKLGTARAQYHLRQIFVFLNGYIVNKPEVMIGAASRAFDDEGRLVDETARDLIGQLLVSLRDLTGRLGSG